MDNLHIPESVAIIMDGNGRWAKKRGLPRTMGHKEGCKTIEALVPEAGRLGIKYLTVYAFSTENWKRSEEEVTGLMNLFRYYAMRLLKSAKENNVRIRMIGDRSRFPKDIIESINKLEAETCDNTGLTFVVAANYGGRDEIRRAVMKYCDARLGKAAAASNAEDRAAEGNAAGTGVALAEGNAAADQTAATNAAGALGAELTEAEFADYLDTAGIPDPDLLIRTSGELRLSNFLIWQCAYSEIVITDTLWPDFNRDELVRCIEEYNKRNRRFGGV